LTGVLQSRTSVGASRCPRGRGGGAALKVLQHIYCLLFIVYRSYFIGKIPILGNLP
jgi:hypothetical protein